MRYPHARKALAAVFSATLMVSSTPVVALAETSAELQAQLDDASAKLEAMAEETAAAGELLNDTLYELEETKKSIEQTGTEIEQKKEELSEAQAILSDRVAANYKAGGISLISLLLESTSFDELASNIYYAGKVSERDAQAIDTVKTVRAELEEKQNSLTELESQQQSLADEQESRKADLEQRQADQQAYVNGLSAEVQQKIEEERQAEIARQEALRKQQEEEAARQAQLLEQQRQEQQEQQRQQQQEDAEASDVDIEVADSGYSGGSSVSFSGDVSATRQTIVNAAYSQLGVPYVYGACSPGAALDCSGLTSYCYACAGISLPHSSASQAGYISTPRDAGSLQPGDLVIWLGGVASGSGNHVALYVGGGNIIHANGTLVKLDSLAGRSAYTIAGSVL